MTDCYENMTSEKAVDNIMKHCQKKLSVLKKAGYIKSFPFENLTLPYFFLNPWTDGWLLQ